MRCMGFMRLGSQFTVRFHVPNLNRTVNRTLNL